MASAPPCAAVIFGASGDLAKRKLIPALYELARQKLLPDKFVLVGHSRSEMSDDAYRKECRETVQKHARTKPVDDAIWKQIEDATSDAPGDYGSEPAQDPLNHTHKKPDPQFCTARAQTKH